MDERDKAAETTLTKNIIPTGEDGLHDEGLHCPCKPHLEIVEEQPMEFMGETVQFVKWYIFHYRLLP